MSAHLCGTGSYLPVQAMDNYDIARLVETGDEWIRERTGIIRRHIVSGGETTVSMAKEAGQAALQDAGISPQEVDLLIVSTVSSETVLPCTACEVQKRLGALRATCFDINAACSGFLLSYLTAAAFLESGTYRTALLIGSESLSRLTDWKDRGTCILFGDGAGAAVLRKGTGASFLPVTHSDGARGFALTMKSGRDVIHMDGGEIFKFAVKRVPEVIREVLDKNGLQESDIAFYILHQANRRIVEAVAKHLGEPPEKFPINIQEYGNTSSASIPILLDELKKQGTFQPGQKLLLAGFGAGLTWGAAILEWQEDTGNA